MRGILDKSHDFDRHWSALGIDRGSLDNYQGVKNKLSLLLALRNNLLLSCLTLRDSLKFFCLFLLAEVFFLQRVSSLYQLSKKDSGCLKLDKKAASLSLVQDFRILVKVA